MTLIQHIKNSLLLLFIGIQVLSAQNTESTYLNLKSNKYKIEQASFEDIIKQSAELQNSYAIITFKSIPDANEIQLLNESGISLRQYLPKNSYYAHIGKLLNQTLIMDLNILALNPIWNSSKFHPILKDIPNWALKGNKVHLILSYFNARSETELKESLEKYDATLMSNSNESKRAFIEIDRQNYRDLANIDFVYFIEPVDAPGEPENYGGRSQHRSNMLAQDFRTGTKYDGTGVSIGMHDDGIIGPHIDYEGRLPIQFPTNNNGDHGDHVAGTIMGAGNIDPKGKGMAFGADLYVYGASNNNYDSAVSHYNTYNVVIVSKSYSNGCNAGYTSLTRQLDQQIRQNPSLEHVFSAGNNGNSDCGYGAGSGWANITGGHKMGKNVIATGNLTSTDALASSSSRGPASDGRIKPDICAKGTSVYSTIDENDYGLKTGTSMACPGIAGSLGQLYQAYKDLYSGVTPSSGLIKGTVLNTADDLGNPGPDFKYGWGRINLRRALAVLENNQFIASSISSTANTHTISVPSGVEQVRIMVYWHDYEASTSAAQALVNDIDMTVTDPSSNVFLPWILNPTPNAASLDSNAKRGIDTLNNMEQVTIDNPVQGSYTVTLSPTSIPQGPQPYHVVYEFIYDEIYLTYPNGGEGLVPGETETIRWDASNSSSTFDLEYSVNGGTSWTTIATSINASLRQTNWTVPNNITANAKVRINRGLVTDESDESFNIIGVPSNLDAEWICTDSLKLTWNSVTSASGYTAYMLGNKYMDSVGISSTNSFVFYNTKPNEQYWVSVSANSSASETGRRAYAYQTTLGTKNCPLTNDMTITQIVSPSAGTYPSCVIDSLPLKVYLKNVGIDTVQQTSINCNVYSTGSIGTTYGPIAPGDSVLLSFGPKIDIAAALNEIKCILTNVNDQNPYNDTTTTLVDYVQSTTVQAPYTEDFESYANCGTNNDCGNTICALGNGWINDQTYVIDENDWRIDNDGTASQQTGPATDHNPGEVWGKYLYTEASGDCNLIPAYLTSPCFDLSGMSEPRITWWYHMYGFEMGELHIDLLTQEGWIEDITTPKIGSRGDFWFKDSLDLEAYAGQTISIRFRGITGSGYRSDMAIDDINLKETDPYIGIEEELGGIFLKLYPNPSKDIFFLDWDGNGFDDATLELTDITGKKIDIRNLVSKEEQRMSIDLTGFENGTYILNIISRENTATKKLIKL